MCSLVREAFKFSLREVKGIIVKIPLLNGAACMDFIYFAIMHVPRMCYARITLMVKVKERI